MIVHRTEQPCGTYDLERCFSGYVVQRVAFSATDKIRSHFGALMMDEVKIEIMGDIQKRLLTGEWEPP